MQTKKTHSANNGFTLTELLVAVVIMVVIGVVFTNFLIESLRGRNKVSAINQIKQNGQVVMDQLSNEIRGAEQVICVNKSQSYPVNTGTYKDTMVIFKNGTYSLFRFFAPTSFQNGYIQKVDFTANDVISISLGLCTNMSPNTGSNLRHYLTDTDTRNGVSINTAIDLSYPPPSQANIFEQIGDNIIIKFRASAGVQAGYAYDVTVVEGGIPFSTSVQVRGIKR